MRGFKTCAVALIFAAAVAGCDSKTAEEGARDAAKGADASARVESVQPATGEPATAEPPPKKLPSFGVSAKGVRVGWDTVDDKKPTFATELNSILGRHRDQIAGKSISVSGDREATTATVAMLINALGGAGAAAVKVATKPRGDLPGFVVFTPQAHVKDPAPCSVVATVHENKATAVWKLAGGQASKRSPGMAGPDLTMTRKTLATRASACSKSDVVFVSASEKLDWGYAFDLAASTQGLMPCQTVKECSGGATCVKGHCSNAPKLSRVVLLGDPPVAGRPVEL